MAEETQQHVLFNNRVVQNNSNIIKCGLPQGSLLGPHCLQKHEI